MPTEAAPNEVLRNVHHRDGDNQSQHHPVVVVGLQEVESKAAEPADPRRYQQSQRGVLDNRFATRDSCVEEEHRNRREQQLDRDRNRAGYPCSEERAGDTGKAEDRQWAKPGSDQSGEHLARSDS